jgi:transposase InsO family protein
MWQYEFILDNQRSPVKVKVQTAADILHVSRSGYYKWLKRTGTSLRERFNRFIVEKIRELIEKFPGYGYRRITVKLRGLGHIVNHKRTNRLMRVNNLIYKKSVFHPMTTDSEHKNPVYPNLVRGLKVTGVNQVWVSDITYIQVGKRYIFLAVVMDRYSRRVLGWSLSQEISTNTALEALQMALWTRRNMNLSGLIHHSDRGLQYTSFAYTQCLRNHGIQISNSRKAYPYDNAFMESFFRTLKREEVDLNEYENYSDALKNIKHFIEEVYNADRMHSSLGYKSPIEFETQRQVDKVTV